MCKSVLSWCITLQIDAHDQAHHVSFCCVRKNILVATTLFSSFFIEQGSIQVTTRSSSAIVVCGAGHLFSNMVVVCHAMQVRSEVSAQNQLFSSSGVVEVLHLHQRCLALSQSTSFV